MEYVLDYIMERKRVDDLHQSIKDRRYDKQKYNMQKCGLRNLMYLVEGDPDTLGDEIGVQAFALCTQEKGKQHTMGNTQASLGIMPLCSHDMHRHVPK